MNTVYALMLLSMFFISTSIGLFIFHTVFMEHRRRYDSAHDYQFILRWAEILLACLFGAAWTYLLYNIW